MPLFYYHCEICGKEIRRICSVSESEINPECCGQKSIRTPKGATARMTEVLDNGLMTKRLERLADAENLFKERNKIANKKKAGID